VCGWVGEWVSGWAYQCVYAGMMSAPRPAEWRLDVAILLWIVGFKCSLDPVVCFLGLALCVALK
jgi:hypothetical protein